MSGIARGALLVAGAAALAITFSSTGALAFCRTAGCDEGVGAQCSPAQPNDCGIVLAWPTLCISYSLQADGTGLAPFETVQTAVRQAFDAWQLTECGSGTPGFIVKETDTVACASRDFDQNGGTNANLIVFRDDDWPYSAKGVLALTTVTYGLETGTIRDADMEINTEQVAFTFGDDGVTYDFLSVATHEAGHFLGLAHSPDDDSSMRRDYNRGSTELRTLAGDDVDAICAVYPTKNIEACAPQPEGGLRGGCGDEGGDGDEADGETDEGCAVSSRGPGTSRSPAIATFALACAAAVVAGRRRSRQQVPRA